MKGSSKRTKLFSGIIISFCLLVGVILIPSQHAKAESEQIIGSAESNGIKLTINNYSIKNHNRELIVNYTVQSTSADFINVDETILIKQPSITIGDNRLQGDNLWHKKVSNQKYQGAVKVKMPQYSPAISNVTFKTDSILDLKGEWLIDFELKK
ncbi:hypothetical protein [Oceanobacillus senegalensis]|uniref:hypothetical protein n=1 Tax=Oceanobacillus senegalensis TaxID=1936063 RepID=UPI000A310603|nr:hypothetical protein [Oceanobacillus senegalensis]